MGLLYELDNRVKCVCVLGGPWIQWLIVAGVALMGSHYKTDIVSGVGYPRLYLVVS